jgi:hypothetical protein
MHSRSMGLTHLIRGGTHNSSLLSNKDELKVDGVSAGLFSNCMDVLTRWTAAPALKRLAAYITIRAARSAYTTIHRTCAVR